MLKFNFIAEVKLSLKTSYTAKALMRYYGHQGTSFHTHLGVISIVACLAEPKSLLLMYYPHASQPTPLATATLFALLI